mgnify:CR=1 FL=1
MSRGHRFPAKVIRASAGTGKTFQLTNRFIGLLAAGYAPDAILATTFTRKASGEILQRVLLRLAEAGLDAAKAADLAAHVQDPTLDQGRSLRILGQLVRRLHRLRIGTLDSFFIQLARSYSLELALPPGWQIVDEVEDARLRDEAVLNVLEGESAGSVTRLMHLLTKGQASRSIGWQIGRLVDELYSVYVESPAGAWKALQRHKPLGAEELQAAIDALERVALPPDKRFADARAGDLERAQRGAWDQFLTTGIAAKVLDGTHAYHRKPLPDDVVQVYQPLVRHAKAKLLGDIANQTEATWRLLERFDAAYRRLKTGRRQLRFEDVTRALASAWLDEHVEEVGFRLDGHVAHLLLDEFQDTSALQWRVLHPLAARVVAGDGKRSFFCVGDVKQAIYGWRGGVAEIFDTLEKQLQPLCSEDLTQSWRSSQAVIDTVNLVFGGLGSNPVLQNEPAAAAAWGARFAKHTTAKSALPGLCRLMAGPRAAEGQEQAEVTLAHAARHVAALGREAPGCTIGVLVRKNVSVARLIFELRRQGVMASEEGGNPLSDSPAVQLVLSLLSLADHPGDTAARFHVAHSPLGKIVGLDDPRDTPAACRLALEVRQRLMTGGYGPTLYAWVRQLAPACDARDLNRLLQLVEMGYGYEPVATTRPDDFVRLVHQRRVQDPTSAPVRVMTVHQAKGLQFDIVVLPELDVPLVGQPLQIVVGRSGVAGGVERVCRYVAKDLRGILPQSFRHMFDQHQSQVVQESLCVLYVALTRAVHSLDMIVAPSKPNEKSLRSTQAGLLRAALAGADPATPDATLYQHGDSGWFDRVAADRKAAGLLAPPLRSLEPAGPEGRADAADRIRLAPRAARRGRGLDRISPSALEGGRLVDLAQRLRLDTSAALERGSLIHAWLEQIEWLDEGEPADAVLQSAARGLAPGGASLAALIGQFREMLARPSLRALLARAGYARPARGQPRSKAQPGSGVTQPVWQVWRERPFAMREGDAIYSGRMDRVVVLCDGDRPIGAEVVDFKTDALPAGDPEALEARVEVYRPQIEIYRRAAAEWLGLDPAQVSARLAFVELGAVVEVK